jgi:large subunit ribosomal protein L35
VFRSQQTTSHTCYTLKDPGRNDPGTSMPKLKTHKGASKRFKKTGTGKVVRNHAFARHILTSKSRKRKRKLHKAVLADAADQPVLKRMIPY